MDTFAYKGYLIRWHPWRGTWRIERDGFHICSARDLIAAKRIIDSGLGRSPMMSAIAYKGYLIVLEDNKETS